MRRGFLDGGWLRIVCANSVMCKKKVRVIFQMSLFLQGMDCGQQFCKRSIFRLVLVLKRSEVVFVQSCGKLQRVAFNATVYFIWMERNNVIFK